MIITFIQLSTNGLLSLNDSNADFTPQPFPTGAAAIAPFWADVDTRNGRGEVFYRSTTDSSLLTRAGQIINNAFVGAAFAPQILYIVTWFRVGFFGQLSTNTRVNNVTVY